MSLLIRSLALAVLVALTGGTCNYLFFQRLYEKNRNSPSPGVMILPAMEVIIYGVILLLAIGSAVTYAVVKRRKMNR